VEEVVLQVVKGSRRTNPSGRVRVTGKSEGSRVQITRGIDGVDLAVLRRKRTLDGDTMDTEVLEVIFAEKINLLMVACILTSSGYQGSDWDMWGLGWRTL
jgi:hypothetical protein